jgi:hypothetical protein
MYQKYVLKKLKIINEDIIGTKIIYLLNVWLYVTIELVLIINYFLYYKTVS